MVVQSSMSSTSEGRSEKIGCGWLNCRVSLSVCSVKGCPSQHYFGASWDRYECPRQRNKVLHDHVKEVHSDCSNDKRCYWQGCSRIQSFKANYQLSLHMLTHTGYKAHKCDVS